MNLELTDEEAGIVGEAARVFRAVAPLERFRQDAGAGVWARLAAAGWTQLGGSVEDGALTPGVAAAVFRAAGRQLLVEQFVTSGYLLPALVAHCRPADREALEVRLRRGPGILLGDGRQPGLVGSDTAHGLCFGLEDLVVEGTDPLPVFRLAGGGSTGGFVLGVLDQGGIEVRPLAGLSPGVASVEVSDGRWSDAGLDVDDVGLARIERTAMLLHSAALVGCAEQALAATRDYVADRVQFGVPIGSFQAVKHGLADVLAGNEVAWSSILCAVAGDADDPYRTLVARLLAVDAALAAARAAAQFHGGIGFTWDSDVHWFLKSILDGVQRFGAPEEIALTIGRLFMEREAPC